MYLEILFTSYIRDCYVCTVHTIMYTRELLKERNVKDSLCERDRKEKNKNTQARVIACGMVCWFTVSFWYS